MKYEFYFLNEGAINFMLEMDKKDLEIQLKEAKKHCDIPAKDAEDLKNQLQDTDFLSVERISPWEFSSIPILDYTGDIHKFGYCRANFSLVNKWGYKQPYRYFQVIYSDDFFVVWLGYVLIGGPVFWVSIGNTVYRIIYHHKNLRLYPNICNEPELITGLDQISLDGVIKKYHKSLRVFDINFKIVEHETGYRTIDLDKYFQNGFLYKGPKYNYTEYKKINYYSWVDPIDAKKKDVSEIRSVKTEDGLFKIKIENMTYPHSGYAYLDLAKLEIVRTKIIGGREIADCLLNLGSPSGKRGVK
jgi:hypothetical protein